jgi:hypothetical protein
LEEAGAQLFARQPELMEDFLWRMQELLKEKIDRRLRSDRSRQH